MKFSLVHLVILVVTAGLIYMLFFAKNDNNGNQGGQTKNDKIVQLVAEACQIEKELYSKYGAAPPPSAKTDPLTIRLMAIFKQLQDLGMTTRPVCPGEK